jgi:hypothetical protein
MMFQRSGGNNSFAIEPPEPLKAYLVVGSASIFCPSNPLFELSDVVQKCGQRYRMPGVPSSHIAPFLLTMVAFN